MPFTKVASRTDFMGRSIKKVDVDGRSIMIIRLGEEYHALDATCTHEDADLSRGILMGRTIVCPLHLSRFSVDTGEVENPPATEHLQKYELKVEGDDILVEL
ncbi:MAG: non-heme iron oxygenase ferredoxin subunit [Thermoplasmata archaeon]|nr:non-heme iron oxygenase ferredoxin subunit [Candidatus Sysuiplasma acidicola]MBX8645191.1 non-heme iron oxygenase ferredoxin subunit [Candidatus Sysuiplasma acidicola]